MATLLPRRAGHEHVQLGGHVVLRWCSVTSSLGEIVTCLLIRWFRCSIRLGTVRLCTRGEAMMWQTSEFEVRHGLQQPLGQKGSDGVECLSSCVEFAYRGDESVRHSHPYVQRGVDTRQGGALHVAARVVEQHFVVSHVHADRRQAA